MEDSPSVIIQSLLDDKKMSETEIADALNTFGVKVTQATINRIKNGEIKRTSFEVGMALIKLREQEQRKRA